MLIFIFFSCIYSITFTGTYTSDDEHILTSRAISVAADRQVQDTRIKGNTRVYPYLNPETSTLSIEPVQGMLSSVLVKVAKTLDFGIIQTLYMFNIWVTALAVVGVFLTVLEVGYPKQTARTVAFLFGLGTIVFPYTHTFFRDTLAMLFLLYGWFFYQKVRNQIGQPTRQITLWIFSLVCMTAGIMTKNTIAFIFPIMMVDFLLYRSSALPKPIKQREVTQPIRKKNLHPEIWLPILFLIGISAAIPPNGLFERFSLRYYVSLATIFLSKSHQQLIPAVFGAFLSPGRSIFLYSPILILSLISLIQRKKDSWQSWAYLGLLTFGQALFYDGEWAGWLNWGLRFILPAIPLLLISSAPVVESALHSNRGRILLIVVSLLSILVQWVGASTPIQEYFIQLGLSNLAATDPRYIWTFASSQLLWGLNWLMSGNPLPFAVFRTSPFGLWITLGYGVIAAFSLIGLTKKNRSIPLIAALFGLCLSLGMLSILKDDPLWHRSRADFNASVNIISQNIQESDQVLIESYGTSMWEYWMNWADPAITFTSLPYRFPKPDSLIKAETGNQPGLALDDVTREIIDRSLERQTRIWLVVSDDAPTASLHLVADYLKQSKGIVHQWNYPGQDGPTQVYLFE